MNFVVGFVVGAGTDFGIQVATALAMGKKWNEELSVESMLVSGTASAVGIGTVSLLKRAGKTVHCFEK